MTFTRLWPGRSEVDADGLLEAWNPREGVGSTLSRPRVGVNYAVTADGAVSLEDGKSGGIGDDGDLAVFKALRDRVDAVLAGTSTVAVEGYHRIIRDPERQSQRVARGLAPNPLAVLISRSGVLPLEAPMLGDPEQEVLAFVPRGTAPSTATNVEQVELDAVTPEAVLEELGRRGVSSVLCEGGPKLVAALVAADVVDDLFVTIAPILAGGGAMGISNGPPLAAATPLVLSHLAERNGSLFVRWTRPG